VDMGRNIFQSDAPRAMMQAVHQVVHNSAKPQEAYQLFKRLKTDEPRAARDGTSGAR
jgi:3-hydroxy-5-phosphonooxypentane-2,4-dione thiolase